MPKPIALGGSGSGSVSTTGSTSTDNAAARFDGTDGTKIQNSGVIIDDSNNVTGVASVTTSGSNGGVDGTEGTGASLTAASGHDLLWADSTAHRWKMNNNNGGAVTIAGFSDHLGNFAATTSAQFLGVISDEVGSGAKVAKFDSVSGNSGVAAQSSGALTNGNFAKFDANGNIVDSAIAAHDNMLMQFDWFGSTSPADSTTYYFGSVGNSGLNTTQYKGQRIVPCTGTVTRVDYWAWVSGTAGSSENSTIDIFYNAATSIGSVGTFQLNNNTALITASATGLSTAVTAGNPIAGRIQTPAWVTNPTSVNIWASVVLACS